MTALAAVVLFSLVLLVAGFALGFVAASRVPWRAVVDAARVSRRQVSRCSAPAISAEDDRAAAQEMAFLHEAFGAHLATCAACKAGHRCDVWLRSFC